MVIIIIIIIIIIIYFYHDIYNYIPETNNISKVCNIAVALCLRYMVRVMPYTTINVLYPYLSSFRSMCAVPNVAVFSSSLMCFLGVLRGDFLNDFQLVPVAPFVFDVTFVFYIPQALCFCCKIFIFQNHFGLFLDHVYIS